MKPEPDLAEDGTRLLEILRLPVMIRNPLWVCLGILAETLGLRVPSYALKKGVQDGKA